MDAAVSLKLGVFIAGAEEEGNGLFKRHGVDCMLGVCPPIDLVIDKVCVQLWEDVGVGGVTVPLSVHESDHAAGRKGLELAVVVVQRKSNLLEIVAALHAASRFAGKLYRGEQQSDQDPDNGDDDEQLDESKSMTGRMSRHPHGWLLATMKNEDPVCE